MGGARVPTGYDALWSERSDKEKNCAEVSVEIFCCGTFFGTFYVTIRANFFLVQRASVLDRHCTYNENGGSGNSSVESFPDMEASSVQSVCIPSPPLSTKSPWKPAGGAVGVFSFAFYGRYCCCICILFVRRGIKYVYAWCYWCTWYGSKRTATAAVLRVLRRTYIMVNRTEYF